MVKRTEITFVDLCDSLSSTETDSPEAFRQRLEHKLSEHGAIQNVRISSQEKTRSIANHDGTRDNFTLYTMSLEGLRIVCDRRGRLELFGWPFEVGEWSRFDLSPREPDFRVQYEFINNEFVPDRIPFSHCQINIPHACIANLIDNVFRDVDLYVGVRSSNSRLVLRNNEFDNRHTSIFGTRPNEDTGQNFNGWGLDGDKITQSKAANELDRLINKSFHSKLKSIREELDERSGKKELVCSPNDLLELLIERLGSAEVRVEDIQRRGDVTSEIEFRDNEFRRLNFGGLAIFVFSGSNKIEELNFSKVPDDMHWGPYQIVDMDGMFARVHKRLFIQLREQAAERRDSFQEAIFRREIIKCEAHLLRSETRLVPVGVSEKLAAAYVALVSVLGGRRAGHLAVWFKAFQDRAILFVGWLFSNHGVSWARPIVILVGVNAVLTFVMYSQFSSCTGYRGSTYIFVELFNPLSSLGQSSGVTEAERSSGVSFLNIVQKLIYGGAVYQVVRVFRRFSGK